MMRLTWLADTLRNAGLRVREQPNWLSRGEAFEFQPIGVVCHHTSWRVRVGHREGEIAARARALVATKSWVRTQLIIEY
jgi:hypothetical protein